MGMLSKDFDFFKDSKLEFEDGVMEFTFYSRPKHDRAETIALLTEAGLDTEALKAMSESDANAALAQAGLDPEEFDLTLL